MLVSTPVFPPSSYIYKIISTAPRQDPLTYSQTDQLAFISSDNSLRFHTADLRPDGVVLNANESITCLERANDVPSNVVATAGRDGLIRFWDKRSKTKALEIESHGLVNIFDTTQTDEDDALYQVINHGSAIAHAGFMYPGTDIYAIGTDETVSFFALQSQKEDEEEPSPTVWGDVREGLGCDSTNAFLIPITKGTNGPLDYSLDIDNGVKLQGAHGEEITHTTYTVGEDGHVRAWRSNAAQDTAVDEEGAGSAKKRRKDKKEKEKARFKPY
ncbi:WD domain [Pyrenophora seminiperda CCB06]|uniref:WD domain n=1 Tax=Pyrenophora seminiperda CCB06 TaxID=1302712 RepID=A0A3M7M0U9_9PLEO|nr:WD domain [Pyrenophora seminiperda CCB06]